ncbi:MAG: metalloregulator ArsR/SmtB family transcription factor, partial [Gemmatimonadetes bacterium]|nr:winged helix-turn-helix transcriptional regulator [Gemmatimonadota bacterium]NIR78085.1 winged helix-turn-helix transcriptional regulator [Gemmatimonadota bacterium]NIT86655.1 winged helix-turn-helix transcriptional regulator [Gemmatimonadota bacterium]NIU30505.1 winged helix-turn-helix transcriptional regulator [Gemmatimonadota bacterium]NIU35347.1 metalloregulator ArsR/SmtB family transcription factor [Gemmatimonadota bacterium]
MDAVFRALSDPIRREILGILRAGERTTGELADRFPVTRPAVSRHLRVLHEARLVERRKEGRNQIYSLVP